MVYFKAIKIEISNGEGFLLFFSDLKREDRYLLAIVSLVAAILITVLVFDYSYLSNGQAQKIEVGRLSLLQNHVRLQNNGSYLWESASQGDAVFNGDSIFTGEQSAVKIRLRYGGMVELGENTLLRIVKRRDKIQIALQFGELTTDVDPKKVELKEVRHGITQKVDLKTGKMTIGHLTAEERVTIAMPKRLSNESRHSLLSETSSPQESLQKEPGQPPQSPSAKSQASRSREEKVVSNSEKPQSQIGNVASPLSSPSQLKVIRVVDDFSTFEGFQSSPSRVEVTWKAVPIATEYRWEVAADRDFKNPIKSGHHKGRNPPLIFNIDGDGKYFLRLWARSSKQKSLRIPASEVVSFEVSRSLQLKGPQLIEPDDFFLIESIEIQNLPVSFGWSQVAGALGYSLEISQSPHFKDKIISKEVEGASYVVVLPAQPGVYHWRVRATRDDLQSRWSKVRQFILR